MGNNNVVAFKKKITPFKSIHCKHCGSYKFAALQDVTTAKLQLWCTDCWKVDTHIELEEANG
jgi:hypothetical protein